MLNLYNYYDMPEELDEFGNEQQVSAAIQKLRYVVGEDGGITKAEKQVLKANARLCLEKSSMAYNYAKYVLGSRWPEGESVIMQEPRVSVKYAINILKGRWADVGKEEAESYILKDEYSAFDYAKEVIKGRWKEAEPEIKKDGYEAYKYAKYIIKGRWLEGEESIMRSAEAVVDYCQDILANDPDWKYPNGRWPKAEPYIMKGEYEAYYYAMNILKKRWEEAEPVIKQNEINWKRYKEHFGIE